MVRPPKEKKIIPFSVRWQWPWWGEVDTKGDGAVIQMDATGLHPWYKLLLNLSLFISSMAERDGDGVKEGSRRVFVDVVFRVYCYAPSSIVYLSSLIWACGYKVIILQQLLSMSLCWCGLQAVLLSFNNYYLCLLFACKNTHTPKKKGNNAGVLEPDRGRNAYLQ